MCQDLELMNTKVLSNKLRKLASSEMARDQTQVLILRTNHLVQEDMMVISIKFQSKLQGLALDLKLEVVAQ